MLSHDTLLAISVFGFIACAVLTTILWLQSRKEHALFCVEAIVVLNSFSKVVHREYHRKFEHAQRALVRIKSDVRKELTFVAPHYDVTAEVFSAGASHANQNRPVCHKASGTIKAIR